MICHYVNEHKNHLHNNKCPDAIILRSKYNNKYDTEAPSFTLWMGILGDIVNTSYLLHQIPEDHTALFRFLEPGNEKNTAIFPFLEIEIRWK